ncbi:MAG: YceH family protein [Gemmatimonadaceae bacterium]
MDQFLTDADVRVLGALIEKQITTPDNYPLSLNALVSACNQSSNRQPVVSYDEETVLTAITHLRRASLVRGIQRIDSRVTKYEHTAADTLDVSQQELAVLCVLMLRGPNTVGELRTRTERLATFEGLPEIESTLTALIERDKEPLVVRLPRKVGQKEVRYAHLLSGEVAVDTTETAPPAALANAVPADDRVAVLEQTVADLRCEVADIRRQLEEFRKQFE